MIPPTDLLDLFLALTLLWLARHALFSRDLFQAVVLYIIFGIVLALAWVRLRAPDIALAEAAIGAGLTGALLLKAVSGPEKPTAARPRFSLVARLPAALLFLALTAILLLVVANLPDQPGLAPLVTANMAASGVENRVTAVLLNFRGYDTMLEVAVLLLAATGVLSLRRTIPGAERPRFPEDPVLSAFSRLLIPLLILMAGHLLLAGSHAPGGAFQAGAVLGAGLVLLRLANIPPPWSAGATAALQAMGLALFLFLGAGLLLAGNHLLAHPSDRAGTLILLLESSLALSTAFILAELFSSWRREEQP